MGLRALGESDATAAQEFGRLGVSAVVAKKRRRLSLAESSPEMTVRTATISGAVGLLVESGCQAEARSSRSRSGQLLWSRGRSPSMITLCSFCVCLVGERSKGERRNNIKGGRGRGSIVVVDMFVVVVVVLPLH